MTDKLVMNLPEGFVEMLNGQRNGRPHNSIVISESYHRMKYLYDRLLKYREKLELLYVEWDEKNIESYFRMPIWYNAHRRLARYEDIIEDCHRQMFYLLTKLDGNSGIPFVRHEVWDADTIWEDFKEKYTDGRNEDNHIKKPKRKFL